MGAIHMNTTLILAASLIAFGAIACGQETDTEFSEAMMPESELAETAVSSNKGFFTKVPKYHFSKAGPPKKYPKITGKKAMKFKAKVKKFGKEMKKEKKHIAKRKAEGKSHKKLIPKLKNITLKLHKVKLRKLKFHKPKMKIHMHKKRTAALVSELAETAVSSNKGFFTKVPKYHFSKAGPPKKYPKITGKKAMKFKAKVKKFGKEMKKEKKHIAKRKAEG